MISIILLLLVVLWFLGYGPVTLFAQSIFSLNGQAIRIWDILVFFVILWAIGILPSPIRQIIAILYIVWVLSIFGFIALAGIPLSSLLILGIIVGVAVSLF